MGKEAALFVVNEWVEQDTVLQNLFAPHTLRLFPGYAEEPTDTVRSYPYMRYHFIPVVGKSNMYVRRDWCQYFVGDTDLSNVINCIERLMYKLNSIEGQDNGLLVPDYSGKYKIQDIIVHTGTVPNTPSQDLGVWEQGVSFTIYYVIRNHDWAVTRKRTHGLDALID